MSPAEAKKKAKEQEKIDMAASKKAKELAKQDEKEEEENGSADKDDDDEKPTGIVDLLKELQQFLRCLNKKLLQDHLKNHHQKRIKI